MVMGALRLGASAGGKSSSTSGAAGRGAAMLTSHELPRAVKQHVCALPWREASWRTVA